MEPIHFFRAGEHTTSSGHAFTLNDRELAQIAEAYDPRTHEAPIVIGHPKMDTPAYGWVERIIAKPDGLHAIPRQVNPEFAELVRQGSYKKVSAAFYRKGGPNNPKPGAPYLRHIGFLGATPPAVKGLKQVEFAEGEDVLFAEEDVLALREHTLNIRERVLRREEINRKIANAQLEGRFPIGLLPSALAFSESLSQDDVLQFSEGDEDVSCNQAEWFADFVSKLPKPAITDEICAAAFSDGNDDDLTLPPGYTVDQTRNDIHRAAALHMREHGGTYADAVKQAQSRLR